MDAVIGIICLVAAAFLYTIAVYFMTSLFPHEEFIHLSSMGDPHLIALQHGLVYKWYISIPLFMFFLWVGTTGMSLVYHANQLVEEDAKEFGVDSNDGLWTKLPYWARNMLRSLRDLRRARFPYLVERIICVRLVCLWWVVTIPLLAVMPYGRSPVGFLVIVGLILTGIGFNLSMVSFVLDVRLMAGLVGVIYGTHTAATFTRENATMSEDDAPKPDQKPLKGELLPPLSNTPNTSEAPSLKNAALVLGGGYVQRLRREQQEKILKAEAAVRDAAAKVIESEINLELTKDMYDDLGNLRTSHREKRSEDLVEATEGRKEAEHQAAMREKARARERAGLETEQSNATPADDPFMSELEQELAPSPAQKIRLKIAVTIGKMLDGLPEEKAPPELQQHLTELRARGEQLIKDQGLE